MAEVPDMNRLHLRFAQGFIQRPASARNANRFRTLPSTFGAAAQHNLKLHPKTALCQDMNPADKSASDHGCADLADRLHIC
jgi:hypothetical protein